MLGKIGVYARIFKPLGREASRTQETLIRRQLDWKVLAATLTARASCARLHTEQLCDLRCGYGFRVVKQYERPTLPRVEFTQQLLLIWSTLGCSLLCPTLDGLE